MATSETWTSRRSVTRARRMTGASRKTVLIALASNAAVTVTKLAAGLISGSSAMLAEAAHSVADTVNQVFLLPTQPWWSAILITMNILIIYALTVHGRELKRAA